VLLGDGITSLTEEFNPETESKHYINMASASNQIKSYAPTISVEKEYIKDEELQKWIDEKVRLLPVGKEAESDYIRINILETASADGSYPAIKRKFAVIGDSEGNGTDAYQYSGTFKTAGSSIKGSATITEPEDGNPENVKVITFAESADAADE